MANASASVSEYDVIARVVQHYVDGARSGRGSEMKPAFHDGATIYGYVGDNLVAGPIQLLFDSTDQHDPAKEIQARIASIDVFNSVAAVRVEIDNWSGRRYTDLFTMLKVDGVWKIINKVFHLHLNEQ